MEKTNTLSVVFNKTLNQYELENYDEHKKEIDTFIELHKDPKEIENTDEFKEVKTTRTTLRKFVDALKSGRIEQNKIIMGKFNDQLTGFEKSLTALDKQLKSRVDEWKAKETEKEEEAKPAEPPLPKIYCLVIQSYDEAAINKIAEFAKSVQNVTVELK